MLSRALLAVALFALGGSALAQPPGGSAPDESTATALPIPLSAIAAQAEAADQILRAARERLTRDQRIISVEAQLPAVTAELRRKGGALKDLLPSGPSRAALREANREFQTTGEQLGTWRRLLTGRIADLEARLGRIEQLGDKWRLTQEEARRSAAPRPLLDAIAGVQSGLREVGQKLKDRRTQLLALQNEIAREELRVTEALDSIDVAERELRGRLLERNAPPLWGALAEAAGVDRPLWEPASAGLLRDVAQLQDYARTHSDRLLLHAFIFAALLGVTTSVRRRVANWPDDDPELQPSHLVLERPFSSSLLVALLLSRWLHPLAPEVVRDLAGLLLLIPVLMLLPRLVGRALRPAMFGLAAFYLVDQVRDVADEVPLAERILFIAEIGAAALLVLWMIRPARLTELSAHAHPPRALGLAIRGALAILGVAFLANGFGFVSLSRLLGEGVLWSAYAAVVIYGALRVVRALAPVLARSRRGRTLNMVRTHAPLLIRRSFLILGWAALLLWVWMTLDVFAIREPLAAAGRALLSASAAFGAVEVSLGDIVGFAATIGAAVLLSRFVRFVLDEDVFPRLRLGRGVSHAVSSMLHYSVLLLGFLLAAAAAGVEFDRLALLVGAFGVGIGFGLQNVVNNFVSGLILLFERPVQVGDTVEVGSLVGDIRRIGIRSSTVRTWKGAEVILPNSNLISDQVINWTLSDRQRRIDLPVGVAYGTDPGRVQEILLRVAREHSAILEDPPPRALFRGFGESSLDFELRAWTQHFEAWVSIQSELAVAINAGFREAGITIPFPQRDLHLQSVSPGFAGALSATSRRAGDD